MIRSFALITKAASQCQGSRRFVRSVLPVRHHRQITVAIVIGPAIIAIIKSSVLSADVVSFHAAR